MWKALLAALVFAGSPALAIEKCGSGPRVTCVVDGDTFWLEGEKFRTFGYDTPEPDPRHACGGSAETSLGNKATQRFIQIWNSSKVTLKRIGGNDKYGRSLVAVIADGKAVGDILITEGLARRYPDGCEFWCGACN